MNNKGMALISLIVLMPLILGLFFSCAWMIWFLRKKTQLELLCHQSVLRTQEDLINTNRAIMALNPKALWLFTQKKALEFTILTGPPPAKAAAKLARRQIILRQKKLQNIQNHLFKAAKYQNQISVFRFKQKFHSFLLKSFGPIQKKSPKKYLHFKPTESRLAIAVPDIASVYMRAIDHWHQQQISARWNIPLHELVPVWIKRLVPMSSQWSGQCFSHPHYEGDLLWKAAIGKGKH